MKRWIAILLAMTLLCVAALAEGTVKVSGGDTNIRKGPGLGYDIVDVAFEGTVLDYADEISTDERGVDWYAVYYNGNKRWVSSKYTRLSGVNGGASSPTKAPQPTAKPQSGGGDSWFSPAVSASTSAIEVSDYYFEDLAATAEMLGLGDYEYWPNSESPNRYSNDALSISGYNVLENVEITGAGYSLFGVTVGMDSQTARNNMTSAGMVFRGDDGSVLSFEHPTTKGVDCFGYDSIIYVEIVGGAVAGIGWTSYTG